MPSYEFPRPKFSGPIRLGSLELGARYLLSPLAGYTNLSFRRVVRELGGLGLATTDLVNARGLLAGSRKTLRLIETCPGDRPLSVQIFGTDRASMCEAAQLLEGRGVASVDVNMGCPVRRIAEAGSGAGMMQRVDETVELVAAVAASVGIPVTVKMRLGWDEKRITAPEFARAFEDVGVAGIAIHGRTRAQGFGGSVDLGGIRRVVEAVEAIPVIGNGDVRGIPDAARMLERTGCAGVSIGRGALANPWIFRQLSEWEETGAYGPPGNFLERIDLLNRQFAFLEEQCATEYAIITFRKTVHWYLKAMRVRAKLRDLVQKARTGEEFRAAIARIAEEGPIEGDKTGVLKEYQVPVPSGPVERW